MGETFGRFSNNLFCGRIHPCLGQQGQVDYTLKMADFRRGQYISALPNPGGYITVYPPKMIARLDEKVAEASLSNSRVQSLMMELFSKAHSFGCDKQGRINLNDKLIEHAGIDGKAVLVGNFSAFAIWSEEKYAQKADADERNIFDAMRELGL